MKYVIRREGDGKFVAFAGSKDSYTHFLQDAKIFESREAAQKDACGNEYPIALELCFQDGRGT